MHIAGSRSVRRALRTLALRPAEGLLRRLGLPRLCEVVRPCPARPAPWVGPPGQPALGAAEWLWLQRACSERSGAFFSDNVISNESSYLQPATALAALPKGLGYVGVGPEQNFSYLAMLEPALAFVVDVRRDNARLHGLYKALFLAAATRAEWLAWLLGRRPPAAADAPLDGSAEQIVRAVERCRPDPRAFAAAHALVQREQAELGCALGRREERRTLALHRRFAQGGLELRFALHGPSRHRYPSLRSLLLARSPDGGVPSFLGSEASYGAVRRLQQQNRIVPVVGDLSGMHAMRCVAAELRRAGLQVGVVYVSNVEQYLFEQRKWGWWIDNLGRLPLRADAVVLRSHLDQGRPHPRQLDGHRITSLIQLVQPMLERQRTKGYASYWQVVTDPELQPPSPAPPEAPAAALGGKTRRPPGVE
jgi:hypothetical protein